MTLGRAAPTVAGASGRAPAPSPPGANAHEVVQALQEIYQRVPDFAPHANLVLERREELGKGGHGAVYRVRDTRLGREAAPEGDPGGGRRSLPPALPPRSRDHGRASTTPAIPPVYEAGTTVAGEAYMLMRVIEGETLSLRIKDLQLGGLDAAGTRELLQVLVKGRRGHGLRPRPRRDPPRPQARQRDGRAFGEVLVMDWGLAREEGKEEVSAVLELGRTQLDEIEARAAGLTPGRLGHGQPPATWRPSRPTACPPTRARTSTPWGRSWSRP